MSDVFDEEHQEVYFDEYCKDCELCKEDEMNDICDECLSEPVNSFTHSPINFVKKV